MDVKKWKTKHRPGTGDQEYGVRVTLLKIAQFRLASLRDLGKDERKLRG